jgi:hypothetical protein
MALYQRVVGALGGFDASPDERRAILDGTGDADSWADVSDDVKQLIVKIENSPAQTWADPADLPDQQGI